MSYILDALKRAERERRQGQVSVLDETPAAPTTGEHDHRLSQRLLAPAAVLTLAALLAGGGWLWSHRSARAPTAAPHHAPAAPASAASVVKPAPPATPSVATPAQPAAAKIEDAGRIGSLDDLVPPPPKPKTPPAASTTPPADAQAAASAGNANAGTAQNVSPAIIAAVKAAAEQSAAPATSPPPASAANLATAAPPGANPATATPAAGPQNLQLMPDSYRAEFPQFSVNVHSYSDDPARRFVLIDGKQYHEGDTLPQGPRIVAIVPEGIVFDWKGSRVLYALNR